MAVTADYTLRIDWDLDGSFATAGDDVSTDLRYAPALQVGRGRDQAREYSPPVAGLISFALDNPTGKYSSENTGSTLYGKLKSGRPVDLYATYSAVNYQLARMFLRLPQEQPYRTERKVTFDAYDGLSKLVSAENIATAMYTSVLISDAIGYVLDAAGWPAADRVIDTSATTLARWWVDGISAFDAIRDLVFTEGPGAIFYIDAQGRFVFESRHYRLLTTRCTTSQATFRNSGTEPVFGRDFQYEPSIRGVVNACTVPVRSYASTPGVTIWNESTLGTLPLTLAPGETVTREVSSSADGFSGATVNSTVTAGSLSAGPTLNRSSGKRATLTMTAGASGATLSVLNVTATTWAIASQNVSNTVDAAASILDYGRKMFPSEFVPQWIPSVNEALDFCNAVVGRRKNGVPQAKLSITNGNATRLIQALTRQISDRVTVVESERSFVDDDFTIEAITHEVTDGRNHQTTFSLEAADDQAYWILGVAGYSELGVSTVLGY